MALGSTQPLTQMNARNLPGSKERPARKTDNLTAICESTVKKMLEPRHLTTLWAFTACYRHTFTSYLLFYTLLIVRFFQTQRFGNCVSVFAIRPRGAKVPAQLGPS
jgi:hypothetical protein